MPLIETDGEKKKHLIREIRGLRHSLKDMPEADRPGYEETLKDKMGELVALRSKPLITSACTVEDVHKDDFQRREAFLPDGREELVLLPGGKTEGEEDKTEDLGKPEPEVNPLAGVSWKLLTKELMNRFVNFMKQ